MFLAEGRHPAALGVKARLPLAGVMGAMLVVCVHHALLSTLLAVR